MSAEPAAHAIDRLLPVWDVASVHSLEVRAPSDVVYRQIQSLDLSGSWAVRLLFRLRGLPRSALTLDGLQALRFAKLVDDPPRELVLGLIGRFWTLTGSLRPTDAADFQSFAEPGFAKAAWSVSVDDTPGSGTVLLRTETRVLCLDAISRRRFRRYWRVVGPFSGWTRTEMLRIVKDAAESVRPTLESPRAR